MSALSQRNAAHELSRKIDDKSAVIGVVGLGYVGLPLAIEFAGNGFKTIGIDLNANRIERLRAGQSVIQDVETTAVKPVVENGMFLAEEDFGSADDVDVFFICVPTPVNDNKDPDTSYIVSAAESLADHLRAGQLVILKSTTYPNTTEGLVQPILEEAARKKGLSLGEDYFLAFSPERIDPGNREFTTANTPIVVGGVTESCTRLASQIVGNVVAQVHPVSSPKVAEMEKLLENIFRSVNIALVNELAKLCDRIGGISIWEVIEAAATKPFGFMPFFPGPGLGGHCIPIDPYYLSWMARKHDFETNFITLAARVNEEMPFYVRDAVVAAVARQPVALTHAKVLLLGVSFKPNVDDTRHSPALRILQLLHECGFEEVSYADPYVPQVHIPTSNGKRSLSSVEATAERVREADVVVIVTNHDAFPYEMIAENARTIIDTRNALKDVPRNPENVILLGGGSF